MQNVQGSYPVSAKSLLDKYFKADWCYNMYSSRSSRKGETPRMVDKAVGQCSRWKTYEACLPSNFRSFPAVQKAEEHGGGFLKVCGGISAKWSWRFGQNSWPMPRTTHRHMSVMPYHQGGVSAAPSLFCSRTKIPQDMQPRPLKETEGFEEVDVCTTSVRPRWREQPPSRVPSKSVGWRWSNNQSMLITAFVLFLSLFLSRLSLSAASSNNMASTVTPSVLSGSTTDTLPRTQVQTGDSEHHTALLAIHSVVLLSGTVSLILMVYMMKSSITSSTSIAVLNLIFTHFIFLLTVPFRIYYHIAGHWNMGRGWCKVTSVMIHIHMYMSFIFYVIILVSRLVTFYRRSEHRVSFNRGHALLVSGVVWTLVLLVIPCVTYFYYGNRNSRAQNATNCFDFGKDINNSSKVLNDIVSIVIIVASLVLTALQANAVRILYRKHQRSCTFQQDFGAQLKSLCFAAIMMICFVPYHVFRLIYLEHRDLQNINEVFLSLTTFNCIDMLTFLGNMRCYMCLLGKKIWNLWPGYD